MRVTPLTLAQANQLVSVLHRHHKPVQGHRFSLGAVDEDNILCGAVIVGRPVARGVAPYEVAEVTRLVTDGTHNACSFLYGVAARVSRAMGFKYIQTYTLATEPGTSLKASGWVFDGDTKGGNWNCLSRLHRRTDQPDTPKRRWIKKLSL